MATPGSASRQGFVPACGGVKNCALIVGCSDGIGLALVRRLLDAGWRVTGVSRSPSPVTHPFYRHEVRDVGKDGLRAFVEELAAGCGPFLVCVYCAGIGEGFDPQNLGPDVRVLRVNLLAAVETAAALIPGMVRQGCGHFVVLSSQADQLLLANSPAYAASKAGVTAYFESLALALRNQGVAVTNVRFGFVDTKMAQSPFKPFLRNADWAADVVMRSLARRRIRVSRPCRMAALTAMLAWLSRWRVRLGL